jgi:regulator of sigma E protease
MIVTIIAFIFVFGLLVFVHELGHFLAAKWMGVTVKAFAFGFPPTLFKRKVGDTEYKINAIPLGGYVSLLGEEDEGVETDGQTSTVNDPKSLVSKEPWQIVLIMIAGVFMNIVLAIVLFFFCYLVGFQPIIEGSADFTGIKNDMQVKISDVEKDSPAEKAGLQKSDIILSVDGKNVYSDNQVISIISSKTNPSTIETKLVVIRGNEKIEKPVTTYQSKIKLSNGKEQSVSRVGIALENTGKVHGDIVASVGASLGMVWKVTTLTFDGIITLFRQLIFHFQISSEVSGPVGIVVMTNYFAQLGFVAILQFAAVLSISLAIFNVLPIPALDGGQIIVTTLEMILRKKFSTRAKNTVQLVGFAFIIGLFLIITVKDLFNFGIISGVMGWFK